MIHINDKANCSGCYACAEICPKKCIEMKTDSEGFWYPEVDEAMCIACGQCEKVCAITSAQRKADSFKTLAYAAFNKNLDTRIQSSSGGIFRLLAEVVLEQGGVVFGAAFTSDYKAVEHICVDNTQDLARLQGAKYVQSRIGDAYSEVLDYLKQERLVLFTGTPCQIEGLCGFLGCDYDNLITQDIICHGVPSPEVWRLWVDDLQQRANGELVKMSFRDKEKGWRKYDCKYVFSSDKITRVNARDDLYMRGFLQNLTLRPSCYSCAFKGIERRADITLADFWGIDYVFPDMNDDKGISLVLIHSEKGKKIWEKNGRHIVWKVADPEVVYRYNSSAVKSSPKAKGRERFMTLQGERNISALLKKYTLPAGIGGRIILKVRRFLQP